MSVESLGAGEAGAVRANGKEIRELGRDVPANESEEGWREFVKDLDRSCIIGVSSSSSDPFGVVGKRLIFILAVWPAMYSSLTHWLTMDERRCEGLHVLASPHGPLVRPTSR